MTFLEFIKKFPTEKAVSNYFLSIRYPDKVVCNHCGSIKVYQRKDNIKLFDCADCHNTFSPFKNTIFEKSSTDLRKWMYAIHLFLNGKKGISAMQLMRETGVTYKTAWRMLQQIRLVMGNKEQEEFFNTIIEIDETYVGGKPRKENKYDDDDTSSATNKRGRGTNKTPVVGVIDRDNKKIYCKVALPNKKGQKLTGKQLFDILNKVCKQDNNNTVISDKFKDYNYLEKQNIVLLRIDHQKMFSQGDTHTNNIESFWATLKRGVYGIYHHISLKYMQRYVDEFCFRYNNRERDMFRLVLEQAIRV
ncbi:MAG: IS1595 family transposase [Desulfocucumaceae bacterium]